MALCCGIKNCTNTFCDPHIACNGTCEQTPVKYEKNHLVLRVPYFVFEGSEEFAIETGAKTFFQLWGSLKNRIDQ